MHLNAWKRSGNLAYIDAGAVASIPCRCAIESPKRPSDVSAHNEPADSKGTDDETPLPCEPSAPTTAASRGCPLDTVAVRPKRCHWRLVLVAAAATTRVYGCPVAATIGGELGSTACMRGEFGIVVRRRIRSTSRPLMRRVTQRWRHDRASRLCIYPSECGWGSCQCPLLHTR
jgi:hypothetical protein